ncbi:amidase [Aquabacterium humicola]|uniref:amidase n=1 Tax=Aquabacterium humicola TaxID=3237377 RepID=UPI002542F1B3|nr:amidase [Rubrivivax pictus]
MQIQINPKSIAAGTTTARDALRAAQAAADAPACRHTFIRRFDAAAEVTAQTVDRAREAGLPLPALAGLPVSVKDLFDVAGQPTTAGSRSLADAEPAARDSTAVARLRAAGAVLVGHTNLSEFAFSGVGINPHHGTPRNPCSQGQTLIPGGSSSGAAVSVATGASWGALGSDTGGSIRIPAALQGLVGFKNTQRLTPLQGCIPLSPTLDTACAITRSVADAVLLHGILSARLPQPLRRPLRALRLAVPSTLMLDALSPEVAAAFDAALRRLSAAGAQIETIELPALAELANLQAQGGFAAAESWAWHRQRLATREADYDPRVAARIKRGAAISAADYLDLQQARARWIERITAAIDGFDALLSPTVPITAPPLQPLLDDDDTFFALNALLLRNPSAVNLLDGCALSLPCQVPGTLPVGLMVWGPALADDAVLGASLAIEAVLGEV